jgi:putative Mn2+ efflux pump MntP
MSALKIHIKKFFVRTMILSVIGLAAGYYLLEEVASWEKVPLGQVFYIIIGCVMIAISGIFICIAIKLRFFPKRRKRKGSKPIFLEDENKKKQRNPDQYKKTQ